MPIITVQMLTGRTSAQKSAFIKEITEITTQTLDAPGSTVTVVLTESRADDWGRGRQEHDGVPADPAPARARSEAIDVSHGLSASPA